MHIVAGMLALISTVLSWLACRIRSRAELELELIALRHQVAVLNRRSGRLRLCSVDRLVWVWLYRLWPRCLETMVLVKPATVVQWHRQETFGSTGVGGHDLGANPCTRRHAN